MFLGKTEKWQADADVEKVNTISGKHLGGKNGEMMVRLLQIGGVSEVFN